MSKIFLSFTMPDADIVTFYEQALRSASHEVFRYDHDGLQVGDPSDTIISERIRNNDYIFVFLSQSYINRPYTIKELNQTVYEENIIGKIKMIIIRIDVDKEEFPRILARAPYTLKNRFYFDASAGMSNPNLLDQLLKRICEPNTVIENQQHYCLKISQDDLKIYHCGEKYAWKRDVSDLLFFEGIGIYFLFDIYQRGLEFKNYIQLNNLDYNPNDFTKMIRDANLADGGSEIRSSISGTFVRNMYILDYNYPQRENGEYTNNLWI